jgi:hypothetical protein
MKEAEDVGRAQQRLEEAQQQLEALQNEMEQEVAAISAQNETSIETIKIAAKRANVEVRLVALGWLASQP